MPYAVAHAEANVHARPDDVWVRIKLGDVHRELGDPTRAEEVYRQAVAQVREVLEEPTPLHHPPVKRTGPKVGRNEPCPCGSRRKYKRCHDA